MWTGYNDAVVKDICYNCDSEVSRRSFAYFRTMLYRSPKTFWSEVYDGRAFYVANRCRDHVRLVEIAVRKDSQGQGVGRKVLFRLLSQMKRVGLYKLTFRTPIAERAQDFWLHIGAEIVGVKDGDYEMEINIKQE